MQSIVFEMETSDPDDFMTLLWLADHPDVDLQAVVVTPGSRDQCQLVRWGLDRCGRHDVPVGALRGPSWWATSDGQKARVSPFHYQHFGTDIVQHPVGEVALGPELLADRLRRPDTTVLVGSAPKNIGQAFADVPDLKLRRWIQQGGFAGDNLVAEPLEKFRGRVTCPSFNPGGAPKETLALLASPNVEHRLFVSKNVCHRVVWTAALHEALDGRLPSPPRRTGLTMMVEALDRYLHDHGVGKAMHDLVAAACALDERVCDFVEVEIYRHKGEWGARAMAGTNTRISIGYHEETFLDVLGR